MNIGQIINCDTANGPGIRVSVFVSGCTNCCEGCFNKMTWDFNYGELYTPETEDKIVEELKKPYYDGITILGGEPFEMCNQPCVAGLIRKVKQIPNRNIWMYTGFTYDKDLQPGGKRYGQWTDEILDSIDTLVDGKFMLDLKDFRLKFRGSSNQRIINMVETRKQNQVILDEFYL